MNQDTIFPLVFEKERILQYSLSNIQMGFDHFDKHFLQQFHLDDAEMIFSNVSYFVTIRPFIKDEFVRVMLDFENYFSISFLSYFGKYYNSVLLRQYYLIKGLSFESIMPYVKKRHLDLRGFGDFLFAEELNLDGSEFPMEYMEISQFLIEDNWKIWNDIVKYGYSRNSYEYFLKYDMINDIICNLSQPSFNLCRKLNVYPFDFLEDHMNLSVDCFCAIYGSEQSFRYLILNKCQAAISLYSYAIIGCNNSIIHFCDQNNLDTSNCIENAILYHHYDLQSWISNRLSFSPLSIHAIVKSRNIFSLHSLWNAHGNHDVNKKDDDSQTPLHIALELANFPFAEFFISNGADINAIDRFGRTPLHIATEKGYLPIVQLIVSKGADINSNSTYAMKTPLHIASNKGYHNLVEFLLSKRADVTIKDKYGSIPLDFAKTQEIKDLFILQEQSK